jgi:hypothetical protein
MKYFFGFLALIAAAVVVVLLGVGLFRNLGINQQGTPTVSSFDLTSEDAQGTIARYTVRGPIVADENYREVRITVSQNSRTVDIIGGYSGTIIRTQTLPNTAQSYRAFLGALSAAGFTNIRSESEQNKLTTCVTGNQYRFEIQRGTDKPQDTWTSACNRSHGDFGGNVEATANLFRGQIPNYSEVANGVLL